MRPMTSSDPILVIGGTGKTGRRVAARLQDRGVPVRIGSRTGAPPFDWEDRSTWAPALHGTRAAYVSTGCLVRSTLTSKGPSVVSRGSSKSKTSLSASTGRPNAPAIRFLSATGAITRIGGGTRPSG